MTIDARPRPSEQTLERICGEFMEMPGLRLTCRQAQRLWGLDRETCAASLEFLADARFLMRIGHDTYARLTDGPVSPPQLRMAKAPLNLTGADRALQRRAV